jgi:hypothetical protein
VLVFLHATCVAIGKVLAKFFKEMGFNFPHIKLLDFKCLNIFFFTQLTCKICYT